MANKKISDLTAGTTPTGAELCEAVQGGNSVKLTVAQIVSYSKVTPNNIALTSNYTLANPTGSYNDGDRLIWRLIQDGTGSRTVTLGTAFRIPSSSSTPLAFSTAPNAIDILAAMWNASRSTWDIISFVPGY